MLSSLLQRELVFVTGKGGAGKTTVAVALALAAARGGRSVALCEAGGAASAPRLLGRPAAPPGAEGLVDHRLWCTTIDPQQTLEEWAGGVLGSRRLAGLLRRSHAFPAFVNAAPGARELLTLSKAWDLTRPPERRWTRGTRGYDLVIVDGPASGHGLGMLRTPHTIEHIARVGPVAAQARAVGELLGDPARSALVAVALPAELPVAEALELDARVASELGRGLDHVVVNAVLPQRFRAADVARVGAAVGDGDGAPVAHAVRAQHALAAVQAAQLRRLRRHVSAPVTTLPHVAGGRLGARDVERLAARLAQRRG
jgi:anion-transporting  ArsA/GET3 family ATPase